MEALRTLSTRAQISATSFTNHYKWGDFKGDPNRLIGRSRLDPIRCGCDLAEVVESGEYPQNLGISTDWRADRLRHCMPNNRSVAGRESKPAAFITDIRFAEPFIQFRPAAPPRNVAHGDGHRLLLSDQHDQHNQPLSARHAGVEQVPLEHRVVLRQDGNKQRRDTPSPGSCESSRRMPEPGCRARRNHR